MNPLLETIQQIASTQQTLPGTITVLRYRTADDMTCGEEIADTQDLIRNGNMILETTQYLLEHHPDVTLRTVPFDRPAYLQWLGDRQDTRDLRSLWATEQD